MALVPATEAEHALISQNDGPSPPACVVRDRERFHSGRWALYTWEELYWWVRLLCTRAGNRAEADKSDKDLADAQNYHDMAAARLAHLKGLSAPSVNEILEAESGDVFIGAMAGELRTALARINRAPHDAKGATQP